MAVPAHLELRHLICRYGSTVAVDDVSLAVECGEHVAMIGANGSGKSTILRAILGLHDDVGGEIALDGTIAATFGAWAERRRRVAWMPQRQATGRFPLLVRELLASSGRLDAAMDAAERLGVGALQDRPLTTLSGGQLQRVFLSRALGCLANGAGLLLADEPTAALDFDTQAAVADLLGGLDTTVLVVTHDRAVAARCDRVVEMAGGRLRAVDA
ncbi:MAG: ATP-binding cassette domain-containing protein [Chloroflexota bacterium]